MYQGIIKILQIVNSNGRKHPFMIILPDATIKLSKTLDVNVQQSTIKSSFTKWELVKQSTNK
jgi:hypothetical protein